MKRNTLAAVAGLLWILAGSMVLKIGVGAQIALEGAALWWLPVSAAIGFIFYSKIFSPLQEKNRVRIGMMDEAAIRPWSFFDKKSYLIMAFMMTFGILLRKSALLPTLFFAVFYTGLGAALFAAGVKYFCQLFARGGVCDAQGDLL